jgi:hypothetical protein
LPDRIKVVRRSLKAKILVRFQVRQQIILLTKIRKYKNMSIDIYVGTLNRYHSGNWETVVAKTARESGVKFQTVRTNPEPIDKVTDENTIKNTVEQWRKLLEEGLKANLTNKLDWNEKINAPYFTDQINWYGYSGLQLLAAHTECKEFSIPEKATNKWNDDPAFKKVASNDFKNKFSQIFNVELWLPVEFPFVFNSKYVTGHDIWFGSSITLLKQLNLLNEETFKASKEQLEQWILGGAGQEDNFIQTTRFGLALFIKYAQLSIDNNLPMKLDY